MTATKPRTRAASDFEPPPAMLAAIKEMRAMDPVKLARWGGVKVSKVDAEFGVTRSMAYTLMGLGLPYTLVGRSRVIPRRALAMLLAAK
jgi:hypothetical protein